jgi:hypothetical protein
VRSGQPRARRGPRARTGWLRAARGWARCSPRSRRRGGGRAQARANQRSRGDAPEGPPAMCGARSGR